MCLITEQKEPIILKEDLEVYKILCTNLTPYFYSNSFQYEVGIKHQTEIKKSKNPLFPNALSALHYGNSSIKVELVGRNTLTTDKLVAYGAGFHFVVNIESTKQFNTFSPIVYKCIIPTGSEVYFDAVGNGVANQIIIKELIT